MQREILTRLKPEVYQVNGGGSEKVLPGRFLQHAICAVNRKKDGFVWMVRHNTGYYSKILAFLTSVWAFSDFRPNRFESTMMNEPTPAIDSRKFRNSP